MDSRLQTQQQVGQAGLPGSGHAGVHAAAVLSQVRLAGFGQRVADLIILSDQLLPGGERLATLRTHNDTAEFIKITLLQPSHNHPFIRFCFSSIRWKILLYNIS